MPIPNNPPDVTEAGAMTSPRQLQRWLDVNRLSKLTRAGTYLEVPILNVTALWKGYSTLIAAYNYTASKNFSLKLSQSTLPSFPNYMMCISWIDSHNVLQRYSLWNNVGEVMYFNIPAYTNQQIKKNFRIEFWTTDRLFTDNFTISSAGTASVNGVYIKTSAITWTNGVAIVTYTEPIIGSPYWNITIGVTSYYIAINTISNTLPTGIWVLTNGSDPKPLAISNATNLFQASSLMLYTSILLDYDYRYQDDASIATASTVVTDFSEQLVAGSFAVPIIFPANSIPTLN